VQAPGDRPSRLDDVVEAERRLGCRPQAQRIRRYWPFTTL
jgi:hypothetical protein